MGESVGRKISPTDLCFKCNLRGHWSNDCPSKTPPRSQPSTPFTVMPVDGHDLPVIHCPCGGGICTVRTSRTAKNPDRQFYSCPTVPQGMKCRFFKWCDTVELEVPLCPCGAGRCSVITETSGWNAGRRYFACRVPKGHGACPFFQWEDARKNSTINEDECETRTVNVDLGKDESAGSCEVTRSINVDSGGDKCCEVSDTANVDLNVNKHVNTPISTRSCEVTRTVNAESDRCKHVNAPEGKENGCEVTHTVNCDLVEDKHAYASQSAGNKYEATRTVNVNLRQEKHADSPQFAETYCRNGHAVTVEFGSEQSKRMRSDLLMVSSDLRYPDYNLGLEHSKRMRMDLSVMATQHHIPDLISVTIPLVEVNLLPTESSSKQNDPSEISNPSENIETSTSKLVSVRISATRDNKAGDLIVYIHESLGFHDVGWLGRLVFPPQRGVTVPPPKPFFCGVFPSFNAITVPEPMKPSDHQATSVEQLTVRSFRGNLLILLKSMHPRDHEYMARVANPILDALDHLSPDNSYFRKRVKEFINCASALSQTERSIKIGPSSQYLIDRYKTEKARLYDITREQAEAVDAFEASGEVCALLHEEASRLKILVNQIETRILCVELETLMLEVRVHESCEAKTECRRSMVSMKEELRLRLRKEEELLAAKKAFKKARTELVL